MAMKSHDKDCRFMAARDVTEILLNSSREFDYGEQDAICSAILLHLEDPYVDNQANAVKSLQLICPMLSPTMICTVLSKLGHLLESQVDTLVDIFGSCIQSLLAELPDQLGGSIVLSLLPSVRLVLASSKFSSRSLEACLDVLHALLTRKFPLDNVQPLSGELLALIHHSESSNGVVRRATVCLGALVGYFVDLDILMKETFSFSDDWRWVQFIYSAASSNGNRLKPWMPGMILARFWAILSNDRMYFASADFEDRNDRLIEMLIHSLEVLFSLSWIELFVPKLMVDQFAYRLAHLAQFDPNRILTASDFEDVDDEDTSWRIRNSVARLIRTVGNLPPEKKSSWDVNRDYSIAEIFNPNKTIPMEVVNEHHWRGEIILDEGPDLKTMQAHLDHLTSLTRAGQLPNNQQLMLVLKVCAEKLIPKNAALVREIDLGAFKHREDDGEGVRRSAIQLVISLSEEIQFVEYVGIDKETILGLFLKCCMESGSSEMLANLSNLNVTFVHKQLANLANIKEFALIVRKVREKQAEREGSAIIV